MRTLFFDHLLQINNVLYPRDPSRFNHPKTGSQCTALLPFKYHDLNSDNYLVSCADSFELRKNQNKVRIGFIGSSQTYGSGARSINQSFVIQLHKMLQEKFKVSCRIDTVNMSQSGGTAKSLLKSYNKHWSDYEFDYILVNLATSDDEESFEYYYKELLITLDRNSQKVILLTEANDNSDRLRIKHDIIAKMARQLNLQLFDLQHYIDSSMTNSTGQIWWDFVHFNQYGHDLVATWLYLNLVNLIKKDGLCR